jgi:peptide/nickel transport system substrate-binding protein
MERRGGRGARRREVGAISAGALAGLVAGGDRFESLQISATSVAQAAASLQQGSLVGTLEGPMIVTDGTMPTKFGEAPALASMVKAGSLPPVEQRLPKNPMVIKPLQSIGKYGGTWRRAFTGPGDGENGNRICSTDKPLFWDYTGTQVMPCHASGYDLSSDGKIVTLTLREGMKWSDGAPFTADDYLFWYEHIFQNKELMPSQTPEMSVNGKQGTVKKIDDITVQWVFPDAYPLFIDILAGSTALGAGHATRGDELNGSFAPSHYLKKFHPAFVGVDEATRLAKEAGYDNWVLHIKFLNTWRLNVNLPVLTPWKTTSPINTPNWVIERNPYYYAVDTEGNQLPYIDKIIMTLAENLEIANLRAIAGEIDLQSRHMDIAKIPVFIENAARGGYRIQLDPGSYGSDATFHFNHSFEGDAEVTKWFRNVDFRRALSLGINREQLNETFWLGVGTVGSPIPEDASPYFPGIEWRTKWHVHDPKQANALLDGIGLTQKDSDGYRLRSDGKGRLRIEATAVLGSFIDFARICETVGQQWKAIGIQIDVLAQERSLAFNRALANETQIMVWVNDGSENLFLFPRHALPVDPAQCFMGINIAKWYASGGKQGTEPVDPAIRKALEIFRSAASKYADERAGMVQEIWKLLVDNVVSIGTVGLSPAVMGIRVVKNSLVNVPARQMNAQHCRTPCTSMPPTFFYNA